MAVRITKRFVDDVTPDTKARLYLDAEVKGFALKVTPADRRVYVLQYRMGGREASTKRYTIGEHGSPWTPDSARKEALRLRGLIATGTDPAIARKQARAPKRRADTVGEVIAEFIERHAKAKTRDWKNTERIFNKHVLPRWRERDITEIRRRDVVDLLDNIVDAGAPIAANRTLAHVRKLFNWAIARGIIETTPIAGVEPPGKEAKRDRALEDAEIPFVWRALEGLAYPFGPFMQLALITGQRRTEVAAMRWTDVDDQGIWTLSSEQTKADRAHLVPLPPAARDLLAGLPRLGPYVLTTTGKTPISGYSKAKARADAAITKGRKDANLAPLAPWTIHDLRRTVATGMGRLGISRFIQGRVLNHADRTVTGIYDRYEYLVEKRHALETWGAHLQRLLSADADKRVVPLRR